jgi:hypothetical protein
MLAGQKSYTIDLTFEVLDKKEEFEAIEKEAKKLVS